MSNFTVKDLTSTLKGMVVRVAKRWPSTFGQCRKWLDETQWWNEDNLKKLQLRLLKRIISHAYETVPHYTSLMNSLGLMPNDIQSLNDITKFPILRRADVESAGDRLFSKRFNRKLLRTTHTGGTTGVRLTLKRDLWSIGNEHAFVRRQFDWAGIGLSDPCAYMMWRVIAAPGQKTDRPYVYDGAMKELTLSSFHLSERLVPKYLEAIAGYKIKAIIGYPSAIYVLAKGCLEHRIHVPLKAVLTTAETLDSAKREIISEAFECKVYDFYGGSERVCYIHMCEHGTYHIVPEYGLTELLLTELPNENSCRIIATGFWNMAMPFIRYDTGDLVQPSSNVCQCGRAFPVVRKIIGRDSAILTTPCGRTLGPTALECIMENVLFDMKGMPVLEAQMIQDSPEQMTLEYVPLRSFSQSDADKLTLLVRKHFPEDFKASVRPVEKISRTVSGKALSLVISQNPK